jgi:hypothetical protein
MSRCTPQLRGDPRWCRNDCRWARSEIPAGSFALATSHSLTPVTSPVARRQRHQSRGYPGAAGRLRRPRDPVACGPRGLAPLESSVAPDLPRLVARRQGVHGEDTGRARSRTKKRGECPGSGRKTHLRSGASVASMNQVTFRRAGRQVLARCGRHQGNECGRCPTAVQAVSRSYAGRSQHPSPAARSRVRGDHVPNRQRHRRGRFVAAG